MNGAVCLNEFIHRHVELTNSSLPSFLKYFIFHYWEK